MPYKSYLVNYASFLGVAVGLNTFLSTLEAATVNSESSLFPNLHPLKGKFTELGTTADKLQQDYKECKRIASTISQKSIISEKEEEITKYLDTIRKCQKELEWGCENKWVRIQAVWLLIYSVIILFLIGLGLTGEEISLQALFFVTIIFNIITTGFHLIHIQLPFKSLSLWIFISVAVQILSLWLGYLYETYNCSIYTLILDPLWFVASMVLCTLWSSILCYITISIISHKSKLEIDKAEKESKKLDDEIRAMAKNLVKVIIEDIGANTQRERLKQINTAINNTSISK